MYGGVGDERDEDEWPVRMPPKKSANKPGSAFFTSDATASWKRLTGTVDVELTCDVGVEQSNKGESGGCRERFVAGVSGTGLRPSRQWTLARGSAVFDYNPTLTVSRALNRAWLLLIWRWALGCHVLGNMFSSSRTINGSISSRTNILKQTED